MARRYDFLIFDWDGTLSDSAAHIVDSLQKAIACCELEPRSAEQIRALIGLSGPEVLLRLYPNQSATTYSALMSHYQRFYQSGERAVALFPGVLQTLPLLNEQGYILAVATGKGAEGLSRALAQTGLGEHIAFSRTACQTRSKPHPQMLFELMEQAAMEPEQTLMIGDTSFDLELAANAGVDSVAVSYGMHPEQELINHQPKAVIDSFSQLLDFLASNDK